MIKSLIFLLLLCNSSSFSENKDEFYYEHPWTIKNIYR